MHFGTNDVWNNFTPANILNAYTAVLNKLRMVNPNVRVMVAQIIPLQPSGWTDCPTRAQNLNAQIPAWAASNSTAASARSPSVESVHRLQPSQGQEPATACPRTRQVRQDRREVVQRTFGLTMRSLFKTAVYAFRMFTSVNYDVVGAEV